MLNLMFRLVSAGFRFSFRMVRWCVGRSLQLVGLVAVVLAMQHPRTVQRYAGPEVRMHLRSAAFLWQRLQRRWNPPPPLADAPPIHWPVETTRVTSGFGSRRNPVTGRLHVHRGVDVPVPIGTPVRASRTARVITAREDALNGKYVVLLDEEAGLRFAYCHLSELLVEEGERVEGNALIARSGNTGRSTGPHLHFGVWFQGAAVDPLRLAAL